MPRKLVDGSDYPTNYRGQVIRLAEITTQKISDLSSVTRYFATEETDYADQHYLPGLIFDESVQRFRSLQTDAGSLKLQNVDGTLETFLAAERWEGGKVRILDYFTGLGEGLTGACELIRGILGAREADEQVASWPILPLWDPQTIEAPPRTFSRNCTWRFKSPECGYVGAATTCDKTFAMCTTYARTHRFNGFIHISRELVQTYSPAGGASGTPDGTTTGWLPRQRVL